jgi:tetratricopeptide (TPR) repeat protein
MRGIAFEQMGLFDKSIADYDKGLELNPENKAIKVRREDCLI